ncbi:MAG: hypothetical protein HY688_02690 [Chloroflexi bacterium]|nr:hypothetical protein [Chloroflexota bacterium]
MVHWYTSPASAPKGHTIVLDIRWLQALRRNHAAEHGTIAVLARRLDAYGRLGGWSVPNGFYIYGPAPTAAVEEAAREAVDRLRQGEEALAVSPFCGTNFLLAGALAAIGVGIVLGRKNRLQRLPQATGIAVLAVLASFRLGSEVQRRWTTQPAVGDLRIEKVVQTRGGRHPIHRVYTRLG